MPHHIYICHKNAAGGNSQLYLPASTIRAMAQSAHFAIAIEQNSTRLQYIADNAAALGTPYLQIVAGKAPTALKDLPQPDAIFIGGGATTEGLFEVCWEALRPGRRFVANAVTVESEQKLLQWHNQVGGELIRVAVQRAPPIGGFLGWNRYRVNLLESKSSTVYIYLIQSIAVTL